MVKGKIYTDTIYERKGYEREYYKSVVNAIESITDAIIPNKKLDYNKAVIVGITQHE